MRAIKSNLTSLQEASKLAVIKTNLLCRERLEGKLTKEQKGIYFQTMGINKDNLSDPLVIELSNELKKYISSDCRSIARSKAVSYVVALRASEASASDKSLAASEALETASS